MTNYAATLAVTALLASCSTPPPPPTHLANWHSLEHDAVIEVSQLFTLEERDVITQGAEAYNRSLGVEWLVISELPWLEAPDQRRHYVLPNITMHPLGTALCTVHGCVFKLRPIGHMWVTGYESREAFKLVVIHELGHGAGINHLSAGVMQNPLALGLSPCVDKYLLEVLAPEPLGARESCIK